MVYSNDQWIQLPTKDIYDTNMMLAAVQAAKDMYEKGVKQLEDFNKTYGDFYSPIGKDMEWYNQNVTGKVRDTINNLYAQGIDPIRSAEGRAVLQQLIHSMPTGTISALKTNAANYQEYLKNKAELQSKGMYDKDQDDYLAALQGLPSEQGFSTVNPDGSVNMWGRLSPNQKVTLHDLIDPTVDTIKPGELTADEVRAFGMQYDPRYKYTGVSERMLSDAIRQGIPQIQGSPHYAYFRNLAERQVQAEGIRPDDPNYAQKVDDRFRINSINSVRERLQRPTSDENKYTLAAYNSNLRTAEHARNAAVDHYYRMLEDGADEDGDGKISASERKNYSTRKAAGGKGNKNMDDFSYSYLESHVTGAINGNRKSFNDDIKHLKQYIKEHPGKTSKHYRDVYLGYITKQDHNNRQFLQYVNADIVADAAGAYSLTRGGIDKLITNNKISSLAFKNTNELNADKTNDIRQELKEAWDNGSVVEVSPEYRMRYQFDKNGKMRFYKPVTIRVRTTDDQGKESIKLYKGLNFDLGPNYNPYQNIFENTRGALESDYDASKSYSKVGEI